MRTKITSERHWRTEFDGVPLRVLNGSLPTDVRGHVFIVGPAGHSTDSGGHADSSLLTGDGMVFRIDLDGGSAFLRSRLVRTPCFYADSAAATSAPWTLLRFADFGLVRLSPRLGARNLGNTAFLVSSSAGGPTRLFVTYDGGRPVEIDSISLDVKSPLGANASWRSALSIPHPFPVVLSTAHPAADPLTKEVFSVNYGWSTHGLLATLSGRASHDGFLYLMRWQGFGEPQRWRIFETDGTPAQLEQAMHQIAVTRHHVILMETSMKLTWTQFLGWRAARLLTRPQRAGAVLWIVRREDLDRAKLPGKEPGVIARRVALPLETAHFLADYNDDAGIIHLHVAHNCALDIGEWIHRFDKSHFGGRLFESEVWGFPAATPMDVSRFGRYSIDPRRGRVLESATRYCNRRTWGLALYAGAGIATAGPLPERYSTVFWTTTGFFPELLTEHIHRLYAGYPRRCVPLESLETQSSEGQPSCLIRFDHERFDIMDSYELPNGSVAGAIQWLPGGSNGEGYLLVAVTNRTDRELWTFDAAAISRGPICALGHPELRFGLTLHTAWLERLSPASDSYCIPIREDIASQIHCSKLTRFFEEHVFSRP